MPIQLDDNKSILNVTDTQIEKVITLFDNWILSENNDKYFRFNDEMKLVTYNNIDSLNNKDFVVGTTNCYKSILPKYTRTEEEGSYIYTEDNENGTYTKVTGQYELITELQNYLYTLNDNIYTQSNSGIYYLFIENAFFLSYRSRQIVFENNNSLIFYRSYQNQDWSDWKEIITEDNLSDKFAALDKTLVQLNLLNAIYPIGCVYTSFDPTNPEELFGGTWEQLSEKFLYSVAIGGGENGALSTGGSDTISLEENNIPAHTHQITINEKWVSTFRRANIGQETGYGFLSENGTAQWENSYAKFSIDETTGSTGEGSAFSIMPPYQEVYMWKRTK